MTIHLTEGKPGEGMSFEALHQQERRQLVSLLPLEIAALLSVLRSLELAEHPHKRAAEYLRWTLENDAGIDVFDEGLQVCIDEYVRQSDIEAEGL